MLPAPLTTPPATGTAPPAGPALPSGPGLEDRVVRGAWARESGDAARARATFDSALVVLRSMPPLRMAVIDAVGDAGLRAIVLAAAGHAAEARGLLARADSTERAKAMPSNLEMAEAQNWMAYAYLLLGDRDAALARLERLLVQPSGYTPAMLRTMWPYRSLHGDPRFRRLAEMDR
jgi:hypothetical protein